MRRDREIDAQRETCQSIVVARFNPLTSTRTALHTPTENLPEEKTSAVQILLGIGSRCRCVRGATVLSRDALRQKFFAAAVTDGRPAYTTWHRLQRAGYHNVRSGLRGASMRWLEQFADPVSRARAFIPFVSYIYLSEESKLSRHIQANLLFPRAALITVS